jgi:hypothetical protein
MPACLLASMLATAGGYRAATLALGYVRALHLLGLTPCLPVCLCYSVVSLQSRRLQSGHPCAGLRTRAAPAGAHSMTACLPVYSFAFPGGYRAATLALGYVRAMHLLGLTAQSRYLASNSGGSWFNAAFSYQQVMLAASNACYLLCYFSALQLLPRSVQELCALWCSQSSSRLPVGRDIAARSATSR